MRRKRYDPYKETDRAVSEMKNVIEELYTDAVITEQSTDAIMKLWKYHVLVVERIKQERKYLSDKIGYIDYEQRKPKRQ